MSSLKNVVLVGAAGNIGRCILQALQQDGFNVTIMSRADSSSTFEGIPDSNIVKGEYTPEFFRKVFTGQDALVMAVASAAIESQKPMIDAAAEVGVKRIIPSEFGSDTANPDSLEALPFNRAKKDVTDYLSEVVKSHPKSSWTGLVSGPFFDWCLGYGLFGFDTKYRKATIYDNGTVHFDTTNIGTIGKAVAKILSKPDKYQNEKIYISGLNIKQLDILEALKKATGDSDWELTHRSAQSLREQGQDRMSKGDFMGILDLIDGSLFQDGNGSNFSPIKKVDNEELGVNDSLDETVQKYVDSL